VALFDNILEMLGHGSDILGAGGGFLAAALYRRLDTAAKNAKLALSVAKEVRLLVTTEFDRAVKDAKQYTDDQLSRIARGSQIELQSNQQILDELAELRTRMSSVEDDADRKGKEDREWLNEVQRSLGRIEGELKSR